MRLILCFAMILPGAATAHPGHLAEVAGHGHWLGAAAIGAAIAIGLWAKARGRKTAETEAEDATEDEPQEA
ncbi:DUF6732 family protein [Roseovarius aestuariivivens]|uniref:DUF6732 family protein n=1 Tax=Roseovarius aestuariivivens TaxID=1888910 RepID=UPI001081BA8C|nr:DUF6732 family protein [Roseovarius aestuariivivens]